MITREQVQAKIQLLTAEREQVQAQANNHLAAYNAAVQNVSAYNGAIQALQQLLEETAVPDNGKVSQELMAVLHE